MKKAWLLIGFMLGQPLDREDRTIPTYQALPRRDLERTCELLKADLYDALTILVTSPRKAMSSSSIRWLAQQFDLWLEGGLANFTISTVHDFETIVGQLTAHSTLEIPPYTELLLQPGTSVAFRHPEYMLVRDLGLLYDLYLDAESLCIGIDSRRPPLWAGTAGENVQALARAVIQTCFNLLESFVSGLARAHVMTHPTMSEAEVERLLGTRDPLKRRIRQIPGMIVGRECPLDPNKSPLSTMFGPIKQRRDAFVHCEPGPALSEHGYIKEAAFHDVTAESVLGAVVATHQIIREVWRFVKGQSGPRWLPDIEGGTGRFGKDNLKLVPPDTARS